MQQTTNPTSHVETDHRNFISFIESGLSITNDSASWTRQYCPAAVESVRVVTIKVKRRRVTLLLQP